METEEEAREEVEEISGRRSLKMTMKKRNPAKVEEEEEVRGREEAVEEDAEFELVLDAG